MSKSWPCIRISHLTKSRLQLVLFPHINMTWPQMITATHSHALPSHGHALGSFPHDLIISLPCLIKSVPCLTKLWPHFHMLPYVTSRTSYQSLFYAIIWKTGGIALLCVQLRTQFVLRLSS
ncbi:hypothetical protein AOLI_G00172590 [Acnodon oligacanthus]